MADLIYKYQLTRWLLWHESLIKQPYSYFNYCLPTFNTSNRLSKGYPFKNIFDFTTAGDWDCVAAVERLPALHYSVDFIFLSFGIMGCIVELWNY